MDFINHHQIVLDSLKQLLYKRHGDIFTRLDFEDDSIYEDPLLFAYINQKDEKWLDSIICGYEKDRKDSILVFSNMDGVIYIPKIGYFLTDIANESFTLVFRTTGFELFFEKAPVSFVFEDLLVVDLSIEIIKYQHPLLESILVAQAGLNTGVTYRDIYKPHLESLSAGLNMIRIHNPELFQCLAICLRKILMYSGDRPSSFATMAAHNLIFLNVRAWDTKIYFSDQISHEGAHLVFFTSTFKSKTGLFKCPFNTLIAEIKNSEFTRGTVYLRFHGLYTFYQITRTLSECIRSISSADNGFHEMNGRFVFHMNRFQTMINLFNKMDILSDEGLAWFDIFQNSYADLLQTLKPLEGLYKLGNQPYDFNLKIFRETNNMFFDPMSIAGA